MCIIKNSSTFNHIPLIKSVKYFIKMRNKNYIFMGKEHQMLMPFFQQKKQQKKYKKDDKNSLIMNIS